MERLTRRQHHFVPLDWVENVDDHVHLGKAAREVKAQWNQR